MSWENDPIAPGAAPWENDPVAGPSTKEVLSTAVKVNPDQAARAAQLAKTYPAPQDVLVRNLQNVELIDAVNKADQRLQTSPKLAEYMRNSPFVAQQAHDDIEPLAQIESNMAAVGAAAAGRGVLSISESIWRTPDAAQRVVGYVASLPEQLGLPRYLNPIRGVQDAIRFFSEGQLPVGPKLFAGTTDVADRISDASNLLSDAPETFGSAFADVNTLAKNTDQALTTLIKTGDPQQLGQVLTSPEYWAAAIGQAAPSLAMALYSGGAPAFLAWMEGMEQASSAADFEQRTGVAVSDAEFVQATAQTALINAWLEKAGLDRILGAQGKGLSGVLKAALAEGSTEALQEINQNLSAMLAYDEGRELLQGAVMAFMGGAGSGGGVSATSQAAGVLQERLSARQREEADAQRRATQLQEALALAAQSKLRERNPETFQQLVQQMAEQTEGAPQSVFIDAQVLLQSATPEQLAQLLPSTAEQLQEAAATNSMIEVPIAEALTNLPGTPLEQVFLQNARANESALSLAEAQQAADQAQEFLKQEADRVMQEAADQDAWVASVEKIKTTLLEQLNTAGRFTPDVNEAYATLVGQFFSVMAARTGTTPEALYARYPLRVTGVQPGQGEQVLNDTPIATYDQGEVTVTDRVDEMTGLPLNSDGTVTLYHHTSAANAETIKKSGMLKSAGEPDVYLTTREIPDTGYGDTVVRVRVDPAKLQLDDEFPDGRIDFRVNVGRPGGALRDAQFDQAPTAAPSFSTTYTDPQGETYEIRLTQETFGVGAGRELTVQVGAFQGGQRRARVDFELQGNTLAAGNTITAEAYRGRGLAEAMYRAAREAGYDIMPGRKQTADGERMVARLREKGVINIERGLEQAPRPELPETIEVDGVQRPTRNSNGQPIHPTEEGIRNFWRWFGDSKVADDQGRPLVVYHGTNQSFDSFSDERHGRNTSAASSIAFFFTEDAREANEYAELAGRTQVADAVNVEKRSEEIQREISRAESRGDWDAAERLYLELEDLELGAINADPSGQNIMPVYLSIQNPMVLDMGDGFDGHRVRDAIAEAKAAGHDGLKLLNVYDPVGLEGREAAGLFSTTQYVAFRPEQIKSATGNRGTFDPANASILEQGPRGTFSPSQLLITLGETSDLSTFLHESGHFFLEVMADLASQPDAPAEIVADMNALLKWFGVPDLAAWNGYTLDQKRKHHERFAESFEQYLLEGKAPSTELQGLFRKFRAWLVAVYKNLTQFMRGRDLQVSDDIRRVFDRMLATDEQIAAAEEAAGMLPDFDATNEAIEQLQSRRLRDMKWMVNARAKAIKALQKQAKELRKSIEAEVRAEVEQQPVYAARKALRAGPKLSIEGLESLYMGDGDRYALLDWKPLVDQKLAGKEGIHPDIAADMFGFTNGDALVRAILDAEPIDSVIEGMTDQRMLERHGDLVDERAIQEAANEAVHNEARARVLATELKAQADALNPRQDTGRTDAGGRPITVNALVEAAKQFAQNLAARRRVKDLKSAAAQHRAAEARAAKRWQEATAKGDTQAAVQAKRDQLLNNYAAKALQEAQAEVKKMGEFFARVTKGNDEKVVKGGRDPDVVNAMRAILAAHDVAPRLEKGALDYMEVVRVNDPAMYAALQPSVAAAVSNAKPLREMTLEELRGLNDELRAMWLLAKRSRQMEVDGNLLDVEEAADQLVARMQEIGVPDSLPGEKGAITPRQELGIKLQFAKAILSRVEQWAERMDGKFGGPFLRLVFQPIKEAADRYRADRVKYRKRFVALLDNLAPAMPRGPIEAPELGYTFGNARDSGMAELLHALLHTGNDSNKRKLLLGRGWATENPDGTLDTRRWDAFLARMHNEGRLQKVHWDFAQGVWDLLEEMKPLAQETHRKVFGRYFAEVTANVVETPFGTYRGGYVPAQTDARIVRDAKLRELAEGENESMAYAFPAAPSGFTKARVEYNRPLLLDLRALAQHMDKVLLFSHMQGAVNDVRRLLTQKNVSYALDRIDPGAYEGMLIPWLNRAAKQIVETPTVGDRKISRFLSAMRNRAGMALMFANLSNTFQQITGFSLAAVKVRPGLMVKAMAEFTRSPKAMQQRVAEASAFMKDRMLHEVAAMNDAVESILVDPSLIERGQAWTQKHAYFLQAAADKIMSPIIWTAAYNQAIEGGQSERDAIRFADGVVRQTQGTTLPEDVSRFETGPAAARMFTQFVSYFNMMANTNATAMKQIVDEVGVRRGAGKLFYVALMGLLVPIWVAEAIAVGMRGGPEDEDDDGYLDDWLAAVFGFGTIRGLTAQIPIVGQVAQLAVNRFNDNPADDKFSLSPAVSLIESSVSAPASVYKAIVEDGNKMKAARDVAAAATMATGLPIYGLSRPLFYATGVADDRVEPTSGTDFVRGLLTGTASPESRVP